MCSSSNDMVTSNLPKYKYNRIENRKKKSLPDSDFHANIITNLSGPLTVGFLFLLK